ncbi:hypothetical protein DPEC_G00264890 [Dallia pectoralis]|uniref:Uncharacterized protein n=1 Tax=Dallia pectoralis TaxID=75939 RepID=A0ACC2FSF8_DALPE|nr:hypothetical protein DPEC_G00264890 [Dallia pectoralis]
METAPGANSVENRLTLDLGVLEDSDLTEQQKLRCVLDWTWGFLGTTQPGNHLNTQGRPAGTVLHLSSNSSGPDVHGDPAGTIHNVVKSVVKEALVNQGKQLSRAPYPTQLPSHTPSLPHSCGVFSGPEFWQSPRHGETVLSSGQQGHTDICHGQHILPDPGDHSIEQTTHTQDLSQPVQRSGSIIGKIRRHAQVGPGFSRTHRHISLDSREAGGDVGRREDIVLGVQDLEEKVLVLEESDLLTRLDITRDGSVGVETEIDHLETPAQSRNTEGLSVYEKYRLYVSHLDHLRTEQNQTPAYSTTPPADQLPGSSERPVSAPAKLGAKQPVQQDNKDTQAPFETSEVKNGRVNGRDLDHHISHQVRGVHSLLQPVGGDVPWLSLPEEVWLSVLTFLPHRDLSTVAQVCLLLLRLTNDHTLWQVVRVENSFLLTDQWLSSVGGRNPRSLTIYRCSGSSITTAGLKEFFKRSHTSLMELNVISCIGTSLHGDLMLTLSGRYCDHMTAVDVSWSGATDLGIKALTDNCTGLKTVIVNGCQVTDEALNTLVMRHRESLCRLEVFGCLSISPFCLGRVSELCPGLEALNIGQVPKVTHACLTLVTSRLKHLHTLNLTGLHAVSDNTVHQVLQHCADLQSLTLSFCPGVTDLSMHHLASHAPHIRLLDVSGCCKVSDSGVKAVAVSCRRLQHLDLSSTATATRGVNLLANYCSTHLLTVKLSSCQIKREAIHKLCRHCKKLKVLHLYGCAYIPTEKEIREINSTVKLYPQI